MCHTRSVADGGVYSRKIDEMHPEIVFAPPLLPLYTQETACLWGNLRPLTPEQISLLLSYPLFKLLTHEPLLLLSPHPTTTLNRSPQNEIR